MGVLLVMVVRSRSRTKKMPVAEGVSPIGSIHVRHLVSHSLPVYDSRSVIGATYC